MTRRVHLIVSRGQTLHPDRRTLEDQLISQFADDGRCQLLVVPHLYDLKSDGPSVAALREIADDVIVLTWLVPRAAFWILDRFGIRGRFEQTEVDDEELSGRAAPQLAKVDERGADGPGSPQRRIVCLDLRSYAAVQPASAAIRQMLAEFGDRNTGIPEPSPAVRQIDESVKRRWYPVIDFSRCTNCLECLDFCLFGVYSVDEAGQVFVELPDQCRKGCPACSRVCPEQAIMFPQHKLPAIAGELRDGGSLKMNLSNLFGAADDLFQTHDLAARERDEHLLLAGQPPAGTARKPHQPEKGQAEEDQPEEDQPKEDQPEEDQDELDTLMDQLDELDV
jgi:NAD-dependent dihydropyrimidine dehydrogenase PreA subunit